MLQVLKELKTKKKKYYKSKIRFQLYLHQIFLGLIAIIFLSSLCMSFTFALAYKNFDYNCPLYSRLNFRLELARIKNTSLTKNVHVNLHQNSEWTSEIVCHFVLSNSILLTFYSILSMFFFVMFNMKDLIESDFCLLLPWLLFSLLITILVFISSFIQTQGLQRFCDEMKNAKNANEPSWRSCRDTQFFSWNDFLYLGSFYDKLVVSACTSWITFVLMVFVDLDIFARIKHVKYSSTRTI
jgi:hypothetical protein